MTIILLMLERDSRLTFLSVISVFCKYTKCKKRFKIGSFLQTYSYMYRFVNKEELYLVLVERFWSETDYYMAILLFVTWFI